MEYSASVIREFDNRRKQIDVLREDKAILLGIARFLTNAPLDEDEDEKLEVVCAKRGARRR